MPSEFDPPDADQLTSVVVIRRAAVMSTRDGTKRVWSNTVRRAAVIPGKAAEQTLHGLPGSTSPARVLLGPPDPKVVTKDLIVDLSRMAGDPVSPAVGDVWVDETVGIVRRQTIGGIEDLGGVPAGTSDIWMFDGSTLNDVRAPIVYVVDGPAVDAGDQGVLFKVGCVEST